MSSADQDSSTGSKGSDAEWLTLFIEQHDTVALQRLIEKHSRLLMSVCWQILQNHADAEDAFQATVVQLVKDAASIRNRNYVSTWLYSVAQRESIKILRRQTREPIQLIKEPSDMRISRVDISQDQLDELAMLHEELDRLPEKYRGPLVLCYLEGKSRQEAARELDVTVSSIKASLASGRNQLQKKLLKRGIVFSSVLATWNVSQLEAGLSVSTTLVQHAIHSGVAQVSTVTTGTTSLSTSMTGSKGLLTKGMTWMTVSMGKKAIVGFIGAMILLGGATATLLFNEPEDRAVSEQNQKQDDPPKESPQQFTEQDMKDLIKLIKKKEKLYENFEINFTLNREQFGKKIEAINGGPINPGERLIIEDPEAIGMTGNRSRLLKSSELKSSRVSQNGMYRGDLHRTFLFSNIEKGEDGLYFQWFEDGETVYEESFDGEKHYTDKEPATYFSSAKLNPFHLFFMYKPEGRFTFMEVIEGKKQFEKTIMNYHDGARSTHAYHLKAEIESRDFAGEDDLIVIKIQPVTEDEKLHGLLKNSLQVYKLYLSVKHNLIPVRIEQYIIRSGFPPEENEKPYTVFEVNSWTEPEPGIWYPEKTTEYDRPLSPDNPTYKQTATYEVISFNPQYPKSFFVKEEM